MKANVVKEKENIVKLEMSIPAKDMQVAYENAIKTYSQYVNIPGFRKGKAPRNMVERQVGKESIQQEALNKLLPRFIDEAVRENNLDIVTQPELTDVKIEDGKDVEVTLKLELKPELTVGEYKNLKIDAEDAVIPADAVEKSVERLLHQYSEVVTVTEARNAKESDIVVIDFDGSVDGEKIKGGAGQNYNLDLANSNFIPGFAEAIVGKPMNEEFDVNVTFPAEYHEEALKGKPAVFKVTVKEIKERIMPELNDEFAKKVGNFETVEALKADVQKHLDTQKENARRQNAENAIFAKVMESVKVEIPQSMIKREFEALKAEYEERFSMQGLSLENVFKAQGQDVEKVLTDEAEARIKNTLLIDKIAKDENIKLTPADIQAKLQDLSRMYGVDPQSMMQQFSTNLGVLSAISQQAINDKVRAFLADNNKVNYVVSAK